ncbi:Os12g0641100 [Oryza sativa Japonica Group]|jgi:hypothetical protein|uniref:Os12g0641100 protein n=1 Tax=Oryza sativa subsp. japonica TaxID=39947 RepID=A0A0P0YCQ9_ORYSJ|nr:hypothetical protein EE612_061194 [Oryza sativa]BAT18310.1 Os12g0641100 [Oryza sativa Japonica Group]
MPINNKCLFPSIFLESSHLLMWLYQAQDALEVSGVLTVMTLGMLVKHLLATYSVYPLNTIKY